MARPSRSPARPVSAVVLLVGLVAVLVGLAGVALNEPTQLPDVASSLVVQTHAQVTGERTLTLGVALVALAAGLRLGAGTRPTRGRPARRPAARPSTARKPRGSTARTTAVTRSTARPRPRKVASK